MAAFGSSPFAVRASSASRALVQFRSGGCFLIGRLINTRPCKFRRHDYAHRCGPSQCHQLALPRRLVDEPSRTAQPGSRSQRSLDIKVRVATSATLQCDLSSFLSCQRMLRTMFLFKLKVSQDADRQCTLWPRPLGWTIRNGWSYGEPME